MKIFAQIIFELALVIISFDYSYYTALFLFLLSFYLITWQNWRQLRYAFVRAHRVYLKNPYYQREKCSTGIVLLDDLRQMSKKTVQLCIISANPFFLHLKNPGTATVHCTADVQKSCTGELALT